MVYALVDSLQTPVSMSSMLMHHNEFIFPDPLRYDPQRWMGPGKRQRLEKYLVNFSKGTRQCVGIKYVEFSVDTAIALGF